MIDHQVQVGAPHHAACTAFGPWRLVRHLVDDVAGDEHAEPILRRSLRPLLEQMRADLLDESPRQSQFGRCDLLDPVRQRLSPLLEGGRIARQPNGGVGEKLPQDRGRQTGVAVHFAVEPQIPPADAADFNPLGQHAGLPEDEALGARGLPELAARERTALRQQPDDGVFHVKL